MHTNEEKKQRINNTHFLLPFNNSCTIKSMFYNIGLNHINQYCIYSLLFNFTQQKKSVHIVVENQIVLS